MIAVFPASWRLQVRSARQRGDRITTEAAKRVREFEDTRSRVAVATTRAENAAVILLQRHEDVARQVAKRYP